MSTIGSLSNIPLVDERGYITQPWFRYITGANPTSGGGANQVLHGNPGGGYPTWSPVDLTADVTGTLPVAKGGTGLPSGVAGAVLAFLDANTIFYIAPGVSGQVLHGNGAGLPFWSLVNLIAEVTGTLPVANGGTGVTTATGVGSVVRAGGPLITGAALSSPVIANGIVGGQLLWSALAPFLTPHLNGADANVTSVPGTPTTILSGDAAVAFIVHDQTSGGMALGLMDATLGLLMPAAFNNITGITFTHAGGIGLQANVTAGANPRSLSVFGIRVGA